MEEKNVAKFCMQSGEAAKTKLDLMRVSEQPRNAPHDLVEDKGKFPAPLFSCETGP